MLFFWPGITEDFTVMGLPLYEGRISALINDASSFESAYNESTNGKERLSPLTFRPITAILVHRAEEYEIETSSSPSIPILVVPY
jgi:hypothetical protein